MAKDYKKLKKAFADDPEMVRSLEMEEQMESVGNHNTLIKEFYKEQSLSDASKTKLDFIQEFFRETLRGNDGHTPTVEELEAIIVPLIPAPIQGDQGEDGKDYVLTEEDKKQIARSIRVPTIEKVIERTEVIKEQPIVTEKLIEKDIDEDKLFNEFVKFLKKKKLLDVADINGMQGFSKDGINYRFEELMHGGGGSGGGSITYSYDLSSQCNGVNKVFTVPTNTNFVQLSGTDAPLIYRPTTDYTGSGTTTLTLTAAVNAPSLGATLILLYVV